MAVQRMHGMTPAIDYDLRLPGIQSCSKAGTESTPDRPVYDGDVGLEWRCRRQRDAGKLLLLERKLQSQTSVTACSETWR